jgi:hypothetical protein
MRRQISSFNYDYRIADSCFVVKRALIEIVPLYLFRTQHMFHKGGKLEIPVQIGADRPKPVAYMTGVGSHFTLEILAN